jgi:hypothetical protein
LRFTPPEALVRQMDDDSARVMLAAPGAFPKLGVIG